MKKSVVIITIFLFSIRLNGQDLKPYTDILLSQWRMQDIITDTTIFYKDTLVLTRKYTYKVAHNPSFLFKEGGSLQVYYACHTYSSEPDKEYCTPVYGQWELIDPKNINLFYTDIGIYREYKIESFSDEFMTLVMKK
jgi:hypothetical protein